MRLGSQHRLATSIPHSFHDFVAVRSYDNALGNAQRSHAFHDTDDNGNARE